MLTTVTVAVLLLCCLAAWPAGPILTHVTDPTPPGRLLNLMGDGWSTPPEVRACRLSDGDPGSPPGGKPGLTAWQAAAVLKAEPQVLTVSLPGGKFGVWALQVRNAEGWSAPFLINAPRGDWLSTDRAVPGQTVRVLGRTLTGLDLYPETDKQGLPVSYGGYVAGKTRVVVKATGPAIPCAVERMSAYDVHFRLPADLKPGNFQVFVHNGYGGAAGWSGPLELSVRPVEVWPQQVFDVTAYGALGDGKADDAPAIQAALEAAKANGGGIVYLPPGSYLINTTLTVPRKTVVRGESRERTWIWLPNGVHYGLREIGEKLEVGLQGDGEFTVERLTVHGVYAKHLILAPAAFADRAAPGADNVTVRDCRLMMEPTLRHPYRRGEPFLENERLDRDSSWSGRFCVCIRGDYATVQDSHLRGGGSCVHLEGGRYCTIQRNELLKGTGHCVRIFPSTTTPEKNIIEDNLTRPVSNVHSATMWTHVKANRYYIARNRFESDWCRDNENICWHSLQNRFCSQVVAGQANGVKLNTRQVVEWAGKQRGWPYFVDKEAGALRPEALVGYDCLVVKGPGLGQLRVITANTADTVTLNRPWDLPPGPDSIVALCQNPQFQGHIVVDNTIDHSGPGIAPWGNAYDMVVDGNRLSLSGGINMCDVGAAGSYREYAGNYLIQMLHNTMAEGRYHGKWNTRAATHIFQGTMGLDPQGASVGTAGVDWIFRGNRTETDALMCVVPSGNAQYRGVVMEENVITTARTGVRVGAGVSGAMRGNSYREVEEGLSDEGSAMWIHPAERMGARLESARTVLGRLTKPPTVGWAAAAATLEKLRSRPAEDPQMAQEVQAVLWGVWEALAKQQPEGGYPAAVLAALLGLRGEVMRGGSLEENAAAGRGGAGTVKVGLSCGADLPEMEAQLAPRWPEGWEAGATPGAVPMVAGQQALVTLSATAPAGAWGVFPVPTTATLTWQRAALSARLDLAVGRGELSEWQVVGPFANEGKQGTDTTAHPPEQRVDLKASYPGLGGQVTWKAAPGAVALDFAKLVGAHEFATGYALACLRADTAGGARLTVTTDDGAQAWVNQAQVLQGGPNPGANVVTVALQPGDNYLLCKVTNKGGGWTLRVSVEALGALAGKLRQVPAAEVAGLAQVNPPRLTATASAAGAEGVKWNPIYADDFTGMALAKDWVAAGGSWKLAEGTVRGSGPSAFLCYHTRLPAPVRIEYDARSTSPSDLSACWLDTPGDYMNGYLFAFAAGNESNRIDSYGGNLVTNGKPLATPGKWHHVVAQVLADGRLQLLVDGQLALEHKGSPPGPQGRYAGIWTWGNGEFDNVRLFRGAPA